MRKLIVLAIKEVIVTIRDTGALIAMLVTPLALTLAISAAFGSGGQATLERIPIAVINNDKSPLSQSLLDIFEYPDVAPLVEVLSFEDEALARMAVKDGEICCLIIVPEQFSTTIFPQLTGLNAVLGTDVMQNDWNLDADTLSDDQKNRLAGLFTNTASDLEAPLQIEIYANAEWQISTAVIKSILSQGLEILTIQINGITASMQYASFASEDDAFSAMNGESAQMHTDMSLASLPVQLEIIPSSGRSFSWLNYMATSMAVLFLMFAVTSGSHTLLAERSQGTLQRLLITPNPPFTILAGKMSGVVLMGMLQLLVLWGASSLIGAYWGEPIAVLVTIVVLVVNASGVGAFISAWSQTTSQAGAIGTAVTLVGSALSGSFFPRFGLPQWVQVISKFSPQAWGIEMFTKLQDGGSLVDIVPLVAGCLMLTIAYYTAAIIGFRKHFE